MNQPRDKKLNEALTAKRMERTADVLTAKVDRLLTKLFSDLEVDEQGKIVNSIKNMNKFKIFEETAFKLSDIHTAAMGRHLTRGRVEEAQDGIVTGLDNIASGKAVA